MTDDISTTWFVRHYRLDTGKLLRMYTLNSSLEMADVFSWIHRKELELGDGRTLVAEELPKGPYDVRFWVVYASDDRAWFFYNISVKASEES